MIVLHDKTSTAPIPPLRGGSERSEGVGSYFSVGEERVLFVEKRDGKYNPFRPTATPPSTFPLGEGSK
jgi:hypothetical protein